MRDIDARHRRSIPLISKMVKAGADTRRAGITAATLVVAMTLSACVFPLQDVAVPPGAPGYADTGAASQTSPDAGLIKPVFPQQAAQSFRRKPEQTSGRKWEDQRVRVAAMEIAGETRGVQKIRICYDLNEDEWWIILYCDHGRRIQLRQYVWNRDSEILEKFLVAKSIPKHRLAADLKVAEEGKACEVIDPPTVR